MLTSQIAKVSKMLTRQNAEEYGAPRSTYFNWQLALQSAVSMLHRELSEAAVPS
jgi:hypothetical protein